jgi:hypothetical protein
MLTSYQYHLATRNNETMMMYAECLSRCTYYLSRTRQQTPFDTYHLTYTSGMVVARSFRRTVRVEPFLAWNSYGILKIKTHYMASFVSKCSIYGTLFPRRQRFTFRPIRCFVFHAFIDKKESCTVGTMTFSDAFPELYEICSRYHSTLYVLYWGPTILYPIDCATVLRMYLVHIGTSLY